MNKKYRQMTGTELCQDWHKFVKEVKGNKEQKEKFLSVWGYEEARVLDMEALFIAWLDLVRVQDFKQSGWCHKVTGAYNGWVGFKDLEVPEWLPSRMVAQSIGYNVVRVYARIEES